MTGAHFSSVSFPLIDTKNEEVYNLINIFNIVSDQMYMSITLYNLILVFS